MSAVITLAAFSVFVGALIGAAGIGGVLLVPFMAYALSFEIHTAIAGAMFGYIFAGGVGALLYARHGSIEWDVARWLILGAMPAAFLGSFTAAAVSGQTLEAAIADLDGFYTFAVGTRDGFSVLRDPIACKPAVMAETDDWVAMASEFRSLAQLPSVDDATVWEPEPATVYSWGRA